MFNKDIYDGKLDGKILYDLYTHLKLTDVFI